MGTSIRIKWVINYSHVLFPGATIQVFRRQAPNSTAVFQAGGSPSSASGQQPSFFSQPGSFIDPSFSINGGSQGSVSNTSVASSGVPNTGGSSPFKPSFVDPSKFLSTGQQLSSFTGFTSGTGGSQPGGFPPGTGSFPSSGSQTGGFPPGTSGLQGNSSSSGMQGGTSGSNGTTGGTQSMYPNMFMNPSKFVG